MMPVVETFLDIDREAKILLEDGFELVEDVDKNTHCLWLKRK